eukprot:TRINITY_DN22533_c0_g1_i1.p1 TRINITY_DN22533_c0_g1~~TRINITY_DN22533_c0_g1_i1.p1  ORF type:complete len:391 (-),score=168.69 TRINITY_DN22533_c0_g1_i1:97-1269(-)
MSDSPVAIATALFARLAGSKTDAPIAEGFAEAVKAISAESPFLGSSEDDRKENDKRLKALIKDFLPSAASKDGRLVGRLHKFNKDLQLTTFMNGNTLSVVDVLLYPVFQPLVASWDDADRVLFGNITRWFDWVQHLDGFANNGLVPEVPINKSKNVAPAAPEKPKDAKPKAAADGVQAQAPAKKDGKAEAADGKAAAEAPKEAKPKTNQTPKNAPPKKAADEDSKPEDVSRLDIRVGKIVTVKKHESADTLYVEEIDLGEGKPRQVVSGLVNFVPIEEMQNRMVVVLCNLKPANMRGVKSEAMVLAASDVEHKFVELLTPPEGAKIGERVFFDEFPGEPDAQLNPKKKIWETVQPDLHTNAERVAVYKNAAFKTSTGVVTVKSLTAANIK